jgi:Mlc titration factor MtfA (ptsG expression regulator)
MLYIVSSILIFGFILYVARKRSQLNAALNAPFPEQWRTIISKNLPPYRNLSLELKEQLHQYIKLFLFKKNFEGCGGLEINDEIRVTIAAQACMLLLNRKTNCYPRLTSILVYPNAYVTGQKGLFGDHQEESVRLGESWVHGTVVLSWDSVKTGAANFNDGQNVTMHEFAHRLDQADGTGDGAPILEHSSAYASWARVLSKEYEQLQRSAGKKRRKTVLNKYGATNPAEFFAVATEAFFEKPKSLMNKHPELYEELMSFYKVDPREWE